MIPILIFSKNRPMQLDLLLRSIKRNCPIFHPHIIYKATSDKFDLGYDKLIEKQYVPTTWKMETSIKEDLIDFLAKYKLFGIATDDCVFYRRLDIKEEEIERYLDNETFTVSLRMGLNNKIQNYQTGERQVEIENPEYLNREPFEEGKCVGQFIKWHWKSYPPHSNPGYPGGQDGHIFRSEDWLGLLGDLIFENMRQVESFMVNHRFDIMKEYMVAPKNSVLVNIPANNMQEPFIDNKFDSFSAEELNERYLRGEIIQLNTIEHECIIGAHQAISYKFDDRPKEVRNHIEGLLEKCRGWTISQEELESLE